VHAYEQWGFASLARLNGMFGIALWDAEERTLRAGARPLRTAVYYQTTVRDCASARDSRASCAMTPFRASGPGGARRLFTLTYGPLARDWRSTPGGHRQCRPASGWCA